MVFNILVPKIRFMFGLILSINYYLLLLAFFAFFFFLGLVSFFFIESFSLWSVLTRFLIHRTKTQISFCNFYLSYKNEIKIYYT